MNNAWRRLSVHHGQRQPVMDEPTWRVAFASNDRRSVNQHFGMANGFDIYEIAQKSSRLIEVLQSSQGDNHQGRVNERVHLLVGCRLLFCVAVGEAAKRQLAEVNITAILVEAGTSISSLLAKLHSQSSTPRKQALPAKQAEEKFLAMLADGWDE
ncbi:MAG: hypothetical protein HQL94_10730 [Magnetococcales bacterium]|nr:hypothetical protein [Magnetococcales bacterium]